ncbi:hypothetical protein N0V88_003445 [Collariella sp. IMI 366227]|nr:hypothetical protein N0V88_003445 [Collariella sp. IMI 366227]
MPGKTTTPRPVYRFEYDWICCKCNFNNSCVNHVQCINSRCQHARCSTCGKEARRVRVDGVDNLRDAGGHAIKSNPGKAIRRGVLYRSAHLNKLEDNGFAVLQGLGITKVFDLRSVVEIAKDNGEQAQPSWPGVTRVFAPIFLDKDYSPEALALRFRYYSDGPEVSVIIALVLALCGLDDDAIADEYSLTDAGLAVRKEEIVQRLIQGEALFGDRERAERMVSARKENMLGTLALIHEKYGSVEKYVVDHLGVSPASVDQIRRNLIVDCDDDAQDGPNGEPRL